MESKINMRCGYFSGALLFLLWNATSVLSENICHKYLRELAQKQSAFVQCSTLHSVPVSLCVGCEEPFTEMDVAYMTLRKEQNCTDKYFDKDRINIVSTTQSILAGLWTKAYCPDCYSGNNSYVFDLKRQELEDCLLAHKGQECMSCLPQYLDLNGFYLSLDQHNNGQVCYDMQDTMNRTRAHWSKDLGCCHREFDKLLFFITCGFAAVLPILFYGSMFAFTKWQERDHSVLIEDPRSNGPSTSVNANRTVTNPPSTSSAATFPPVPSPKSKTMLCEGFTSSDESDYEENASKTHDKSE